LKIVKHIPNTITSSNLLCGALGVIYSFNGHLDWAFYLMIAAAVADFFDGFSASLLGAYSPMGKELDSLADMVSFGLLPSVMLYVYLSDIASVGTWAYIPLIIAVFSGLRLAKFNIDERQSENFIGLATPACAMICGSLICFLVTVGSETAIASLANGKYFLPTMSVILAFLLVSEVPMFSMKFKKKAEGAKGSGLFEGYNLLRIIFAACFITSALLVLIAGLHWSMIVFMTFISYILINLIGSLFLKK
jgi:CDP-diacylglycerol--serine O-phosphatidyltransferase